MKTSKRKRSAKARPVVEAVGADVVAAGEQIAEEVARSVVDASVEQVAEVIFEQGSDVAIEQAAEAVVEGAAEPVAEAVVVTEAVEPATETVMSESAEAVVGDPIVVLGSNCSVKDAAALKSSLCAFANHGDAVTLDVSAVERVDTATMQLLCAFARDRSGRNQSVAWRGESAALQDAVRLLGVGALLGLETKGVAA